MAQTGGISRHQQLYEGSMRVISSDGQEIGKLASIDENGLTIEDDDTPPRNIWMVAYEDIADVYEDRVILNKSSQALIGGLKKAG